MRITKLAVCLLFLTALLLIPSCKDGYDDSELTGRVDNLENRVKNLEEQMNSNVSSLQAIMKALENNDYITSVTPIMEDSKEIGYTIHFSKGNPINIYHGQDGQDGYTPQIGVEQDTDGIYYWTLDGGWMTNESGNKIKAQGIDGQDGQDGITPQFKIENDYWYVSYNNGLTWDILGKATGEDAKNFFQSVTVKEAGVEFILGDGTTFVIPMKSKIEISFSSEDEEFGISEGKTIYVDYALHNASEKAIVTVSSDGNFITKVIPEDVNGGKISITSKNGATEGYINVMVSDGNGYTFINVINIFKNRIEFSDGMDYYIGSKGGDIIIPFSINTSYTTKIVDNDSWISINPQSRADMQDETLNISVEKNISNSERTAKIQFCNSLDEEDIFAEISVTQSASFDDAMILTALASSENDYTVYLPKITGEFIKIDWGDGTQEHYDSVTAESFSHRYSVDESSKFDIKIIGDIKGLNSYQLLKWTITGIKQWGISKLESVEYAFCEQPLEFIANDEFGALQNITSFYQTFSECFSLMSIPHGLFDKCTKVTNFGMTFYGCSSLTSIPQGLFDRCTKVTILVNTFSGCSSLTSIPQGLFDKCSEVTSFYGTFKGCFSLRSIPQGLFDKCTEVTDFGWTFSECISLTSIPHGLFDKCTEVTDFNGTFSECFSLRSIPEWLFDKCTKVTGFGNTFLGCLLTFIPQGLFDYCSEVTYFDETFSGCSSLISIPQGLFDKCSEVTSFYGTFKGCSSLRFIPQGLFDRCTKVADFGFTFSGCTKLEGESPYTIIDGKKYRLYERKYKEEYFTIPDGECCFEKCNGLSDYSKMDWRWNGKNKG